MLALLTAVVMLLVTPSASWGDLAPPPGVYVIGDSVVLGAESALGRRVRTAGQNAQQMGPWRTIVGVVSNIRMLGPFNNPNVDESGFYVPFYASPVGPLPPAPALISTMALLASCSP